MGVVKRWVWVGGRLVQPIKDSALAVDDADFVFGCGGDVWVRVFGIDPADVFFAAVLEADGVIEFWIGIGAVLGNPFDPGAVTIEDGDVVVRLTRDG